MGVVYNCQEHREKRDENGLHASQVSKHIDVSVWLSDDKISVQVKLDVYVHHCVHIFLVRPLVQLFHIKEAFILYLSYSFQINIFVLQPGT